MDENPHLREGQTEATLFIAPIAKARLTDEASGTVYEISGNITTIGRGQTNKIVLENSSVSREHCRIERTSTGYAVVDRTSTNGTFINEHRVRRTSLHDGDHIKLGSVVLIFSDEKANILG